MSEIRRLEESDQDERSRTQYKRIEEIQYSKQPLVLSHGVSEILSSPQQVQYVPEDEYSDTPDYGYQPRYAQENQDYSKDSTGFSIQEILGITSQYPSHEDLGIKLEYAQPAPVIPDSEPKTVGLLASSEYGGPRLNGSDLTYTVGSQETSSSFSHYSDFSGGNYSFGPSYSASNFGSHQPTRQAGELPHYYEHVS